MDPLDEHICRLCFNDALSVVNIYDNLEANIPEILSKHIGEVIATLSKDLKQSISLRRRYIHKESTLWRRNHFEKEPLFFHFFAVPLNVCFIFRLARWMYCRNSFVPAATRQSMNFMHFTTAHISHNKISLENWWKLSKTTAKALSLLLINAVRLLIMDTPTG